MSKKNPGLDTQLITYTSWRNLKIIVAMAASKSMSKSATVADIISSHIDKNLSVHQQQALIRFYDKMSEDDRKDPGRYWNKKAS
jgi:hypothetical protein